MTDENKKPAVERNEIATVGTMQDLLQIAFNGMLLPQDATLATRGRGKGLLIYDEIARDPHAGSVLNKRKFAVVGRPLQVLPASDSFLDKKAAKVVKAQLDKLPFDQICLKLLNATLKGYAVAEIIWAVEGAEIVVKAIKARNQRRFAFDNESNPYLLTRNNPWPGEPLPDRKFIVHRFGAEDEDPYGLGLGSSLFWPIFFKRAGIKFWLMFCEKFGMPTAIGTYPAGTSEEDQDKLLDSLSRIAQDAGIIVPDGTTVKFLEAMRSGNVTTYEQLCRYCDEECSKATLGETLTTTMHGASGSRAAGSVHNDVRLELVQSDNDLLSDTLTNTLSRWITEYNVPGANPPRITRDCKPAPDQMAMAERDKVLYDMGWEATPEYIKENYGDGFVKMAKPPVPGQSDPNVSLNSDFAEADAALFPDQVALDAAAAQPPAAPLQAAMAAMIKPVITFLQQGGSADDALTELAEVFPKMDSTALQQLLARAIFVADLWGRINGVDEGAA